MSWDAIIVCDPHASDVNPSRRTDDYCKAILGKLEWSVNKAVELKAVLIIAGDLFHLKKPEATSHHLVNQIMKILTPLIGRVYCVIGNHDFYPAESTIRVSPICTLIEAGIMIELNGTPIDLGEVEINGLRWTEEAETDPTKLQLKFRTPLSTKKIGVYHQYVIPNFMSFKGAHTKLDSAWKFLPDVSIFGHFHDGFPGGVVTSGNDYAINPGGLARERDSQVNRNRTLFVGHLRVREVIVYYANIPVPCESADKVFKDKDDETIVDSSRIDAFAKQFSAVVDSVGGVDVTSTDELKVLLGSLNLDPKIQAVVSGWLEKAKLE